MPFTPFETAASSLASAASRRHHQKQQEKQHERLAAPLPLLLESMRTLLALPCCDARLGAATLRATRYLFRAAAAQGAMGEAVTTGRVVEVFDHLVSAVWKSMGHVHVCTYIRP